MCPRVKQFVYNKYMEKKFKIDKNYFKTKPSKLKTKIILSKYNFSEIDIFDEKPCIYLTPSISEIEIVGKLLSTKLFEKSII